MAKGINSRTGRLKKGYRYKKGGGVVKVSKIKNVENLSWSHSNENH
ncbi:hypothetical protein [Photobacterium arenosum]|nr:hypothetical protein [Photobacterium arenosum]